MNTMSVSDILKIHGKWIDSNEFTKKVAERLNLSKRHAIRRIQEGYDKKEILRVEVGKYVLYGLAEFGPSIPEAPKPSILNPFSYRKWTILHNEAKRKRELKELDADAQRLLKKMEQNEDEWKPS